MRCGGKFPTCHLLKKRPVENLPPPIAKSQELTTRIVFFPFDLFGSSGAAAGVDLLAEAVQEMLDDNRRERLPTRARAYQKQVRTHTFSFDKLSDYQDWKQQAREVIRQAI